MVNPNFNVDLMKEVKKSYFYEGEIFADKVFIHAHPINTFVVRLPTDCETPRQHTWWIETSSRNKNLWLTLREAYYAIHDAHSLARICWVMFRA